MSTEKDDRMTALSNELIKAFDNLNGGVHPGFRPAHAKGLLLEGVFTPSPAATSLTRAPHAQRPSTPVTARFSDSTGIPNIPDNDPNASPRALALRFHLGGATTSDIVSHSIDAFPTHTPEEFLEFLHAAYASATSTSKPTPIEAFLGTHPAALAFVQAPKPFPSSLTRESFFGVNAYKFTNQESVSRFGRYRIRPSTGGDYLSSEAAAAKPANYLFEDIKERVAKGPIKFHLMVQLAESGDTVDDATVHWPETRSQVELGTLELTGVLPNNDEAQRNLIFDVIPRVDGIEASGDPLLEARSSVYLLSGRRRRAAMK